MEALRCIWRDGRDLSINGVDFGDIDLSPSIKPLGVSVAGSVYLVDRATVDLELDGIKTVMGIEDVPWTSIQVGKLVKTVNNKRAKDPRPEVESPPPAKKRNVAAPKIKRIVAKLFAEMEDGTLVQVENVPESATIHTGVSFGQIRSMFAAAEDVQPRTLKECLQYLVRVGGQDANSSWKWTSYLPKDCVARISEELRTDFAVFLVTTDQGFACNAEGILKVIAKGT